MRTSCKSQADQIPCARCPVLLAQASCVRAVALPHARSDGGAPKTTSFAPAASWLRQPAEAEKPQQNLFLPLFAAPPCPSKRGPGRLACGACAAGLSLPAGGTSPGWVPVFLPVIAVFMNPG